MRFEPGDHVVDWIDDALHGLLPMQDRLYVETHCQSCPICAVAMEEAKKRLAVIRSAPLLHEASAALIQTTVHRVKTVAEKHQRRVRRGRWITVAAVAASLFIAAIVHLWLATAKPSAYDLRIAGQSELLSGTEASLRTYLVKSGVPVTDAAVRIDLADSRSGRAVQLASFNTNSEGTGSPRFKLPDWPDGQYTLNVTASSGMNTEALSEGVTLKRAWRLMVSTDKPVYQPGQTIHVRSLALRMPDLHPVAGETAVFNITDPRGNVIFKQTGVTSKYGISSADCALASEILEGTYTIACRIGAAESQCAVEVKHYVLPAFGVQLTADKPFYAPGDAVRIMAQSDYFFGKPVAGASVELQATSDTPTKTVLAIVRGRTDATGKETLVLRLPTTLPGTEKDSGDARVTLAATIRDSAGQEQTRALGIVVTNSPIHLEVIPENGTLVRGMANRVYLLATYADGRPARIRVAVSGLGHEVETDDLGAAVFEVTPTGDIHMTLQARDDAGLSATRQVDLKAGESSEDFLVRTDKAVYNGGETLHLAVTGPGTEPVFIDLLKNGQTLLTQVLEVKGGRGDLAMDLPPDLFGTVELITYRYGPSGLPVRKARILYVRKVDDLHIQATPDRKEYRPGGLAKISFQVTDAAGKPAPGALSLAAVDEAVFSVVDAHPGMEKTFFTLDQQLLKPVYEIYPWRPGDKDQDLLEQAIFSRAASAPAGRDVVLQKLLEQGLISPRMIESLDTPWGQERLRNEVETSDLPAEQKAMFMAAGPYTLTPRTGPENQLRAERRQRAAEDLMPLVWFALTIGSLIALAIAFRGPLIWLLVAVFILILLVAILLPSLGKAREMSYRSYTAANVLGIIHSLEVAANEDPKLFPSSSGSEAPRVRQYFPETLLWRPEVITDDQGRASLEVPLADSITTWRLSASAVDAAGHMGATTSPLRVFQPFFVDVRMPMSLTRNDEVSIPVVVYNYLRQPQSVELSLAPGTTPPWFTLLDEPSKRITIGAGDVASAFFRVRVTRVGKFTLGVTAKAGEISDAVERPIEVIPDGQMVERVFNGTLNDQTTLQLEVPADAIDGSVKAQVKIYPSVFSQVAEGLEGIFQLPYGCFEQTSSTTYPNVLALEYLRRTGKSAPQVEATARQYIHLGYQRLLSFEIAGGGFDWFGGPPAHQTLTAYGLMEFQDMAKVHDVDPGVIARTRKWLLDQRQQDGSWLAEGRRFYHEDPVAAATDASLAATAYAAWAVFADGQAREAAPHTQVWLHQNIGKARGNAYTLALTANALLAMDPDDGTAREVLRELDQGRQHSADGKTCWWGQPTGGRTALYGAGSSGDIETTALAAQAMIKAGLYPETVRGALAWLIAQKDAHGTWQSTQATVLAMKALIDGSGKPLGGDKERRVALALDDKALEELLIPAAQAEVLKSVDISSALKSGSQQLKLLERGGTASTYQVVLRYAIPAPAMVNHDSLEITVAYDHSQVNVGDTVTATATLRNQTGDLVPMVILDLPIPPGFVLESSGLDVLKEAGAIAKYQVTPRKAIVYLRDLGTKDPLTLQYRLKAVMPVKVAVPPAEAYEYYKPESRGKSKAAVLSAT